MVSAIKPVASAVGTSNDPYAVGDPAVSVDTDGDGLIVWTQVVKVNSSPCYHNLCVEIAERPITNAGALGSTVLLTTNGADHSDPNVAVDADGDAYVVWVTGDQYKELIQGRGRSRTGAVGPLGVLSNPIGAGAPIVKSDKNGNSMIGWHWSSGS